MTGQREAYGFLGQEHRDLASALQRAAGNQERDGYALAILVAGRQIDEDLLRDRVFLPVVAPVPERQYPVSVGRWLKRSDRARRPLERPKVALSRHLSARREKETKRWQ